MINKNNCLLVGVGLMGKEYAKVLKKQNITFQAIGRGDRSALSFEEETGHIAVRNGLKQFLHTLSDDVPDYAIVATSMESLAENTIELLNAGVKNILVEKPAGINQYEINQINQLCCAQQANVYVAYNRRFYASTQAVLRLIHQDKGVTSFTFDFTEWSNQIKSIVGKSDHELNNWFYGNSTHIIDLAFFLGGKPSVMQCYKTGSFPWHTNGTIFTGAGETNHNALFSYHANWDSAGRWGIELNTIANKYIFRPIEKLQIQKRDSISIDFIHIDDQLDTQYKPGLFLQTQAFFAGQTTYLKSIHEQATDCLFFDQILCL